jgi:fructuronate reductase
MAELRDDYLNAPEKFEDVGISVPKINQEKISQNALINPTWIHFGAGNLFRAFHAEIAQELLEHEELQSGVIVVETCDPQVISDIYKKYENRHLMVTMHDDGKLDKKLNVSVADAIFVDQKNKANYQRLVEFFENKSLQMVTLSITEKGYSTNNKAVERDIFNGPNIQPENNISLIATLLYRRFKSGQLPIAMLSTDNFSQNGDHFKESILYIANAWKENKFVVQDFIDYLNDSKKVSFPLSMIDRITPNPAQEVAEQLQKDGFLSTEILHTERFTNIAPFSNTEETHYLVIEDSFPNGRPNLAQASGVYLTDRDTVNNADEMKVTTALNPLHTALAIFGSLLGYNSISTETQNPDLLTLIKEIGYVEGLPVVNDPKIIDPKKFLDDVINKRLPNKYIPDTPQRIASDTSQKLKIRYGVTIHKYLIDPQLSLSNLNFIPLVLATWIRYLLAVDDKGNEFTLSPDPMLTELQDKLKKLKWNQVPENLQEIIKPILSDEKIFGIDLYQTVLADKVERYLVDLLQGPDAVKNTLAKTVQQYSKGGH